MNIGSVFHAVYHSALWLLGFIVVVLVIFFLGGLSSAFIEARREKRAGLPVSRPAWEARVKRRAAGRKGTWAALWGGARFKALKSCWCGCGPVQIFPGFRESDPDEYGCAAWEAGVLLALERHDAAGGYARVPVA